MAVLTLREAAQSLGIDPGTLRVQIHNGALKGQKLGRDWVITKQELHRYMKHHLHTFRPSRYGDECAMCQKLHQ